MLAILVSQSVFPTHCSCSGSHGPANPTRCYHILWTIFSPVPAWGNAERLNTCWERNRMEERPERKAEVPGPSCGFWQLLVWGVKFSPGSWEEAVRMDRVVNGKESWCPQENTMEPGYRIRESRGRRDSVWSQIRYEVKTPWVLTKC